MSVYALLQALPTNGYTTAIGAIGLVLYAIGGLVTGHVDQASAVQDILLGLAALGIGNKLEKQTAAIQAQPAV
jgi:hypothetical protein